MPLITISQSLDQSYTKHGVIPDVVDKFDTQGLLTIEYPKGLQVSLGNELTVAETQEVPQIQYTPNSSHEDGETEAIAKEDKFVLVLTDPDAPSRTDKKWSEYAHWLVSDLSIKSNDDGVSYKIDPSEGNALLPYVGPAPPKDTGHHRYVFLLYKQDPSATALPAPADRPNWGTGVPSSGVRDWIAKNAPHSKPLAVNFFRAENAQNEH